MNITYTYDETFDIEYHGDDQNIRLFGYFKCDCGSKWQSAYAWVGYGQECKFCTTLVLPYLLTLLKSVKHAIFNCSCNRKWNDYIYAIRNVDEPNEIEQNNIYEDYNENNELIDYYGEERYYDADGYVIRYDLEPQQCYCGEWVYPIIDDYDSGIEHQKILCQKCQEVGDCTRNNAYNYNVVDDNDGYYD